MHCESVVEPYRGVGGTFSKTDSECLENLKAFRGHLKALQKMTSQCISRHGDGLEMQWDAPKCKGQCGEEGSAPPRRRRERHATVCCPPSPASHYGEAFVPRYFTLSFVKPSEGVEQTWGTYGNLRPTLMGIYDSLKESTNCMSNQRWCLWGPMEYLKTLLIACGILRTPTESNEPLMGSCIMFMDSCGTRMESYGVLINAYGIQRSTFVVLWYAHCILWTAYMDPKEQLWNPGERLWDPMDCLCNPLECLWNSVECLEDSMECVWYNVHFVYNHMDCL